MEKELDRSVRREWIRIPKSDLEFVRQLRAGVAPLEAFRASSDKRKDHKQADMLKAVRRLFTKYPTIMAPIMDKELQHHILSFKATMKIHDQLDSDQWAERQAGIVNARAVAGMDAPTKQEVSVESPHLDNRPLRVPASQRLNLPN